MLQEEKKEREKHLFTFEGFNRQFEEFLRAGLSQKAAYEATEQRFEALYSFRLYSYFDSFKSVRHRHLQRSLNIQQSEAHPATFEEFNRLYEALIHCSDSKADAYNAAEALMTRKHGTSKYVDFGSFLSVRSRKLKIKQPR